MQLWHGPVARHRFRSFDPCVVKPTLTHILGCRDTSYRQESGCYILEARNARATEPQNHGIEEPKSHQEPVLLWEKTDSHVGSIRKHAVAQEGCNKLESYHCRVQRGGLRWARPGVPDSFGASLHCLPRPFPQGAARCHNCWACWVKAKLRMARTLQRTARSQTCGRRTPRATCCFALATMNPCELWTRPFVTWTSEVPYRLMHRLVWLSSVQKSTRLALPILVWWCDMFWVSTHFDVFFASPWCVHLRFVAESWTWTQMWTQLLSFKTKGVLQSRDPSESQFVENPTPIGPEWPEQPFKD